ncbi:MAG: glycine--tRNA ligase subunit alpha [Rickettsiales bacterium]|jgi:glycyl-tRNA synthetase alpha chain|nr:glycine--tRNA ligase subunit alpha [Rickettsiales bacterium]
MSTKTFQEMILGLTNFWVEAGCIMLPSYDVEVGAGTLHPATVLRALKETKWNICYVQSSRRPKDSRYGENPNRLQSHMQFQVILKPSPENIQALYLESLKVIGIDPKEHDIRFVEDDWENPSVGASGLGYEVWLDGMEVSQFTYMQQIGGISCDPIPGELTYGLERLAMFLQKKDNVYELQYNKDYTYGDVFWQNESEQSSYNLDHANTEILLRHFDDAETEAINLVKQNLPIPSYEQCLKASHVLNLLEARGVMSVTERAQFLKRVRSIAKGAIQLFLEKDIVKSA